MPSRYINRKTPAASHLDANDFYTPSKWVEFSDYHRPDTDARLIEWLRYHKKTIIHAIESGHVLKQYLPRANATIEHFQARIDAAKAYK